MIYTRKKYTFVDRHFSVHRNSNNFLFKSLDTKIPTTTRKEEEEEEEKGGKTTFPVS